MRKGSVAIIAELVGRCFTLCVCFFQNNVYCLMSTFIMSLLSKIDRNTQANFWDFISRAANNNTNPDGGSEHSLPLSSDLHHDWSLCFMHSDVVSGVILLHLVLPFPNCPFLYTYLYNVLHIFSIKVKWFWQKIKINKPYDWLGWVMHLDVTCQGWVVFSLRYTPRAARNVTSVQTYVIQG